MRHFSELGHAQDTVRHRSTWPRTHRRAQFGPTPRRAPRRLERTSPSTHWTPTRAGRRSSAFRTRRARVRVPPALAGTRPLAHRHVRVRLCAGMLSPL